MTVQIEQHPRQGVELNTVPPQSPLEISAFVLAGVAMAVTLWAIVTRLPVAGAVCCFVGLLCFLFGYVLEGSHHDHG